MTFNDSTQPMPNRSRFCVPQRLDGRPHAKQSIPSWVRASLVLFLFTVSTAWADDTESQTATTVKQELPAGYFEAGEDKVAA
ncbi:hypothetical protein N9D38_12075, partial [Rubripirellula sp.]|nr:hypothetical protein [Rubripirellula sp.]